MLQLRVKAPFAAFRPFVAGWYRPTAPFITPSAAYGLLLNLAAIESRYDDGTSVTTLMREGLPSAEVALGALSVPEVQTLYQQLHNYPVGTDGGGRERAHEARGYKYNIQPVRREVLTDLDAYIRLRGNEGLESSVREGLALGGAFAPEGSPRYGVPFLGDNSFLISVLREEPEGRPAHWYVQADQGGEGLDTTACRLTVWIDRLDMTKTVTGLYGRLPSAAAEPPDTAWTRIPPFQAGQ